VAKNTAIAIAAHPDDVEFVMAGTLLRRAQSLRDLPGKQARQSHN